MGNSFSTDPKDNQTTVCTIFFSNLSFSFITPDPISNFPESVVSPIIEDTLRNLAALIILEDLPLIENYSKTSGEILIQERKNGLAALGLSQEDIEQRLQEQLEYLLDEKNRGELTDQLSHFMI